MSFTDIRDKRASRSKKSYIPSSSGSTSTGLTSQAATTQESPQDNSLQESKFYTRRLHDVQTEHEKTGTLVPVLVTPSDISEENGVLVSLDGLYTALPSSLEVRNTKHAGRGIWGKEVVRAGTTLISLHPGMHVLSSVHLNSFCTTCCAPCSSTGLKKCTKCRVIWYCGADCQHADWSIHKLECEALKSWASSGPKQPDDSIPIPGEAVRCLGRILWKRKKEGDGSAWWREMDAMQSHRDSISPSVTDSHVQLAHFLVKYLRVSSPDELQSLGVHSVRDLVDLISKFTTNTFTLTTPSLSPIGISVSPLAALINHSCDPNAAIVFPRPSASPDHSTASAKDSAIEPILQVVALRDIAPGTEILTSYIDITLPTSQRQKALEISYNFSCTCQACLLPDKPKGSTDPREAVWCSKFCGGTCPLPVGEDIIARCSICKGPITDKDGLLDSVRVGQDALDKATALQFIDPERALKLTRNITPILTASNLTPSSHPLLAINRLHQSLLISSFPADLTKAWLDETIRIAATSAAGLNNILKEGHPVRAVAIAELGKLLAVDEPAPATEPLTPQPSYSTATFPPSGEDRLALAKDTLHRALNELAIGFGKESGGGQTGQEVRAMLVAIEKELDVWKIRMSHALGDAIAETRSRK